MPKSKYPEFIIKSNAPTKRLNIPGSIAAPNVLFKHDFNDWDYVVFLTQALYDAKLIDHETLTSANDIFNEVYLAMEDLIGIESWEFFHRYCYQRDMFCYAGLHRLKKEMRRKNTYALQYKVTWKNVADKIMELVENATNEA